MQPDKKATSPTELLLQRRILLLDGEITQQKTNAIGSSLIELQLQDPEVRIDLIIRSWGGSTYDSLELCDLMSSMITAPIRGIALGKCGSAATFIMLHCNERIGTPFAQFLIHSGTKSKITIPVNESSASNLEMLLQDTRRTEELVLGLYANKLTPVVWRQERPTPEERLRFVKELIRRGDQPFDSDMGAAEAVEIGLIEKIEHGKLNLF